MCGHQASYHHAIVRNTAKYIGSHWSSLRGQSRHERPSGCCSIRVSFTITNNSWGMSSEPFISLMISSSSTSARPGSVPIRCSGSQGGGKPSLPAECTDLALAADLLSLRPAKASAGKGNILLSAIVQSHDQPGAILEATCIDNEDIDIDGNDNDDNT